MKIKRNGICYNRGVASSEFPQNSGLCAACRNARLIRSSKNSVFVLCEAHKNFDELPKYPNLPVLECPAYSHKDRVLKDLK